MANKTSRKRIGRALTYAFLILGAVTALFPFDWMLSSSFKVGNDIFKYPPDIIPLRVTFDSYVYVWQTINVPRVLFNTVYVTVMTVVLNMLLSGMVSYALVKLRFPGRKALFIVVLAFMMIPFQLLMIPLFVMINDLGLMNTYAAMILPSCLSSFSIFMLRQAMISVPDDYIEAAKIDGCSHLFIYFRIVMPLISPMAVTVAMTNFFWAWNNYLWHMLVTANRDKLQTLQVAISRYRTLNDTKWGPTMASCVITATPIVIAYLFLQRYYIESTMAAGIKG